MNNMLSEITGVMKHTLFLIFGFLLALTAMAGSVDKQTALQKAQLFMPGKQFVEVSLSSCPFQKGRRLPLPSERAGGEALYIFNVTDGNGFVIVSGDDRTEAILGYSKSGHLDETTMPDNMRWWLDGYARQIESLSSSLSPKASIPRGSIAPLIASQWNQNAPYNYMCPDGNYRDYYESGYNAENRCVTGCTATAMAQIMYYWKWPENCPALDSYEIEGHTIKGLPATTFKWNQMKDSYDYRETGTSANAVAELMRYCGQAVKMGYSPDGSGGYVTPEIMANTFGYSANSKAVYRDYYSTSKWESLVYDELAEGRPVLYDGYRLEDSGHQFIIDGYDGNGLFHINWGWSGYSDSYFILSLANPYKDEGAGFQYGQRAILGMQPAEEGEVMLPVMYSSIPDNYLTKTYSRSSASANFTNVKLDGDVIATYVMEPQTERSAEVGWGLFKDGSLLTTISSKTITLEKATRRYYDNDITVSLGAGFSIGTYELVQIYRFEGETQWKECDPYRCRNLVAEITDQKLTIRLPNSSNSSFTVNSITWPKEPEAGTEMSVKANITNTGESNGLIVSLWAQKQGESTWTNIAKKQCYTDPGTQADIVIPFQLDEAGTYNMKITNGSDETALKTATLIIAATETVVIDGISYLCTPMYGRAKVIYDEEADYRVASLTIKSSVTAGGKECKVVGLGEKAFYNYYNVKSLIVPEGVETIGSYAFCYMSSLSKLVLPSSVKKIGTYVINNCSSLEAMESKATTPPTVDVNAFVDRRWNSITEHYDINPSSATLYVPFGAKAKYEAIEGWTMFKGIEEGEIQEIVVDGLRYSYSTGGTTATVVADESYKELESVTIPSTITANGKPYKVTAIGSRVFYECKNIKTVALPEGLEIIGAFAFYDCYNINEMVLPSTLKEIGDYAFYYNSRLKSLIVPEGVETIGSYAFSYLHNLTKLELPSTLKEMGTYVINSCSSLEIVQSKATTPAAIGENTFVTRSWNSDAQQYNINPSSATLYIPFGTKAKYEAIVGWTKFKGIEEGEILEIAVNGLRYSYSTGGTTATVIADESYKVLEAITIPSAITANGNPYKVTAIGNKAFSDCTKLKTVALPEGLEIIGADAFYNCYYISEMVLPSTLKSIGEYAFYDNSRVKSIVVPEGVETIGERVFEYMSSLTKLVLPSTLKEMGTYVINNCSNLEIVQSKATTPLAIDENTFVNRRWNSNTQQYDISPSSATLYVPIGTKAKYEAIEGWTTFKGIEEGEILEIAVDGLRYSYYTGDATATVIADESYKELTSVNIPSTITVVGRAYKVTAIGNRAFSDCTNMKTVVLPEGLKIIGTRAFYDCYNISEMVLPSTLREIGERAFFYGYRMKTLIVPEGVKTIGSYAFSYMNSLTKLTLPSTLKEVGESIIVGCHRMETVVSNAWNPLAIGEDTFVNLSWNNETEQYDVTPSPATLYVPVGTKTKYEAIEGWTKFKAIVESEEIGAGIHTPSSRSAADNTIYNLQGIRQKAVRRGINIVNGRKVVSFGH